MLSEDGCRTHVRHQVDVLTFLAIILVYLYDASWIRLIASTVLRRVVIDDEISQRRRTESETQYHRRGVVVLLVANLAFAAYQHLTSAQLDGTLANHGIFTMFFGTRPSASISRWFLVIWDGLVFLCLVIRHAMQFGNVLGDGEDYAKEAPVVYHLDLIRAVRLW